MYVEVGAASTTPRVCEPDDLKRLEVRVLAGGDADLAEKISSAGLGRLEGSDTVWLDVDALREACGPQSAEWAAQYAGMIDYAASKGWASPDGRHVQAHVARSPLSG